MKFAAKFQQQSQPSSPFFILAKLYDAIEFCILSLKIYDASELKIKGDFLNLQIPRVGDLACDGASCGDGGVCQIHFARSITHATHEISICRAYAALAHA